MRTVPESIKLALQDPSLPIQKRILLYRRVWDAQGAKYTLETTPVDVTGLLVEAGSIKMALDTDEVDKWDASNVTLTFHNDLNCFKEGLKGGLFEQAVLWGSKFVYNIENAGLQAPQGSITVFTGYVYSSPVFRENGNHIELTITSSLDALEYVSAEDFCLSAADELATEVESENEDDQGKEFTTVQTGVGYVDSVKYGADLTSALTLAAGTDYEVSDTNEYSLPAKISLKFTPTAGYKMWVSYRYWHKDMKIEDIVNALLDLAGIERRDVEPAVFKNEAAEITELSENNTVAFLMDLQKDGEIITLIPQLLGGNPYNGRWNATADSLGSNPDKVQFEAKSRLPSQGLFFDPYYWLANEPTGIADVNDYVQILFLDENDNGISITRTVSGSFQGIVKISNGNFDWDYNSNLGHVSQNYCCGFDLDEFGNLGMWVWNGNAYVRQSITGYGAPLHIQKIIKRMVNSGLGYPLDYTNCVLYRFEKPTEDEKRGISISRDLETDEKCFNCPMVFFEARAGFGFTKWGAISALLTQENNGYGKWFWADSEDGKNYSELHTIGLNEDINSSKHYLRVYYKMLSPYPQKQFVTNVRVSQYISSTNIPLINLTDLTVGEAIAQLAKMVSYEIGFNQDGVFFFRSRQGRYADAEIDSSSLIEVDNHGADIDNLANRVSVEFGAFKTTVDDFTEGKPRPNTIDTYGVHEKSISSDNFIPADNVDISAAVAKANYEALSTPGYTVQLDCRPDLSLELGDKITVSSENTQIADKNWSDYSKFLKLPIWKRVFKITGIELSFAKRLMSLTLKDVTSAADVPNQEYNVYQTQFPTPLDYKE